MLFLLILGSRTLLGMTGKVKMEAKMGMVMMMIGSSTLMDDTRGNYCLFCSK